MIKVRVENFQSLSDVSVEVDGFTVVTGTNNTGKTALLRAIRGVFQNTPGTSYVREGETTCKVTLDLGDRKVSWSKGTGKKDRPTYVLDDGAPIYPGQGVPEEVEALGVVPIQAGGQEVWPTIAPQFSGQVFLLDKPGSVLAEAVADVERVGQLNRALSKAESDRRAASSTLKVREADLLAQEAQAKRYEGLDAVVQAAQHVAESHAHANRVLSAIQKVRDLRNRWVQARNQVQRLSPVEHVAVPSVVSIQDLQRQLRGLQDLAIRVQRAKGAVSRFSALGSLHVVPVDDKPCRELQDHLNALRGLLQRVRVAQQRVEAVEKEVAHSALEARDSEATFLVELAALGKCPTCGWACPPLENNPSVET